MFEEYKSKISWITDPKHVTNESSKSNKTDRNYRQ